MITAAGADVAPRPSPFLFRLRPGPDLRPLIFAAYALESARKRLDRVTLVPSIPRPGTRGRLGIEIVSPERQILVQTTLPLDALVSHRPVTFEFAPIPDSHRRGFELRVFAREATGPVHVLEYATTLPFVPRRILSPRVLCGFGFAVERAPAATPASATDDGDGLAANGEADVLFAVDVPSAPDVEVAAGVFSVRGWAYSRRHGPGRLSLELSTSPAGAWRQILVAHRYCRFDVAHAIPSIPAANFAGFEVSVDRFDVPTEAVAKLFFETPDARQCLATFRVRASHAHPMEACEPVRCDCCDRIGEPIGKKDGLTLVRCPGCGLVFTAPRPDLPRIEQRYSEAYFVNEYLPSIQADLEAHRARWNSYLDQVERFRALNPRLFEAGTGAGYLLKAAADRGWTVRGIDVNPAAVRYARDTLGLDVTCHRIDAPDLVLPDGTFGAIILESSLEHFVSPRAVIARCARALQPGGGLFIWTIANDGDVLMREGMAMTYVGPSEHLSYFSATALCRLCEDNDLRVERVWRDETSDSIAVVASKRIDRSEPAEIDQQA